MQPAANPLVRLSSGPAITVRIPLTRAKMNGLHTPTFALGLPKVGGSVLLVMLALFVGGCSAVATPPPPSATADGLSAAPTATQRPVPSVTTTGSIASATPGRKVPASVTSTPTALETATPLPRPSPTSSQNAIQFATLR